MPRVEAWLRGSVPGVPPLLMPAAHAILHAVEDADRALESLTPAEIWTRPGSAPSVGYHLRHLAGSLDRLLTYARGAPLSEAQRASLRGERDAGDLPLDRAALQALVRSAADAGIAQLRATPESTLLEPRGVGRQQLPATVVGLIFHAAEHAARHAGQAITTARIIRGLRQPS